MGFIDKLREKSKTLDLLSEQDKFSEDTVWCPSGLPELDDNLGTHGYPVGITEIAGKSRSGKTTMALTGMMHFQKKYGKEAICILLTSERRDNAEYAEQIGVDIGNVIMIGSVYVEDLFLRLELALNDIHEVWSEEGNAGIPKIVVVWDSLGATLSRAEYETFAKNAAIVYKNLEKGTKTELKHAQMGAFAKNAKAMVKSFLARIYEEQIVMIIINHVHDDFTSGQKKSGGGGWIEFLPTVRLQVRLKEHIKLKEKGTEIEVEVGQKTLVKVVKNDFGSRKPTIIEMLLGYGLVLSEDDIKFAAENGILAKAGVKKMSFKKDKLKWSTKREFYQNYIDKNKFLNVLYKKIERARHNIVLDRKGYEIEE